MMTPLPRTTEMAMTAAIGTGWPPAPSVEEVVAGAEVVTTSWRRSTGDETTEVMARPSTASRYWIIPSEMMRSQR